jgi:hypothetical protein
VHDDPFDQASCTDRLSIHLQEDFVNARVAANHGMTPSNELGFWPSNKLKKIFN